MRQEDNAMSHLTLADRSEIENGLRSNRGFSAIARTLKKARSTVMREILSHRVPSDKGAKGRVTNRCINRCKCDRKYLCAQCVHPMRGKLPRPGPNDAGTGQGLGRLGTSRFASAAPCV